MVMTKAQWTFKPFTTPLGDTGDHESYVLFTNGKDTLQTSAEELDDEQLQQFCNLLNLMPDLWSHRTDAAEFKLAQQAKQVEHLKLALAKISGPIQFFQNDIKDGRQLDGKMAVALANNADYLKGIATEALKEIEEGIF